MALSTGMGSRSIVDIPLLTRLEDLVVALKNKGEQRLPSEACLARQFGVDRFRLRRILSMLGRDGRIYAIRNRGWFIQEDKLDFMVRRHTSYSASMKEARTAPHQLVRSIDMINAHGHLADFFAVGDQALLLWVIDYVRFRDNLPLSLSRVHLRCDLTPRLNLFLQDDASLYQALLAHYKLVPERRRTYCEAVAADDETASVLCVAQGAPLLKTTGLVYHGQTPLEYTVTLIRPELCRIRFDMPSEGTGVEESL